MSEVHVVRRSAEEWARLEALTREGDAPARETCRACVQSLADAGRGA